jgi:hypothetical protein
MKSLRFWLPAAFFVLSMFNRASADPVLYIVDVNGQLGTVDLGTGQTSVIGATGIELTDIAFDPGGYSIYGLSATDLYYVDPGSAQTQLIGPTGIPGGDALVFGKNGRLYGAGSLAQGLYYVDSNTGVATQFAQTVFFCASDLAFNNGELYFTSLGNQLIEVDPGTLQAAAVGDIGFDNVTGLVTGSNGVLYGVSGTKIFSVNTMTGAGTFVFDYGNVPDNQGNYIAAATGTTSMTEAAPQITSPLTATGQIGQNFLYTITTTDRLSDAYAFNLPAGLTADPNTGVITGMPTETGTFSVELYVFTEDGGTADNYLTLTVVPANVPVITSAATVKAKTGKFVHYQITAANTPTSFEAGALPPGLKFYVADGVISGTPTQTGNYAVTISAANSAGPDTGTVNFAITAGPTEREVVTLSATISVVKAESGHPGVFLITRLGTNRGAALRVNYSVEGTAVGGSDYAPIKHFKTLAPGQQRVRIFIHPLGDGGGAGVERVVRLILEPGAGYIVESPSSSEVAIYGH